MLIFFFLFLLLINESSPSNYLACKIEKHCYSTSYCTKIKQNQIKPEDLSQQTCFNDNLTFSMGTNTPVFKSDGLIFIYQLIFKLWYIYHYLYLKKGESPSRKVNLKPFCIDQTEVSNLQFLQFIAETKYRTQVILKNKYTIF
jgi:hypothetical protein